MAKKGIFFCKTENTQFCIICTGWHHDSSEYKRNFVWKLCNRAHAKKASNLESLSNCAAIGSKSIKLCVQIVCVVCNSKGNSKFYSCRALFDNSSDTTL